MCVCVYDCVCVCRVLVYVLIFLYTSVFALFDQKRYLMGDCVCARAFPRASLWAAIFSLQVPLADAAFGGGHSDLGGLCRTVPIFLVTGALAGKAVKPSCVGSVDFWTILPGHSASL